MSKQTMILYKVNTVTDKRKKTFLCIKEDIWYSEMTVNNHSNRMMLALNRSVHDAVQTHSAALSYSDHQQPLSTVLPAASVILNHLHTLRLMTITKVLIEGF